MFKSGVKYLAMQCGKEMKKERLGILNMLKLKQAYFTIQVQGNIINSLTELLVINGRIAEWYKSEPKKKFSNVKVGGSSPKYKSLHFPPQSTSTIQKEVINPETKNTSRCSIRP